MEQISYTESLGQKPFDWHAFLAQSEYTYLELEAAHKRSKSWVTCACGTQCDRIPRTLIGKPIDSQLAAEGTLFMMTIERMEQSYGDKSNVFNQAKTDAITILYSIEDRSAALLQELYKKEAPQKLTDEQLQLVYKTYLECDTFSPMSETAIQRWADNHPVDIYNLFYKKSS